MRRAGHWIFVHTRGGSEEPRHEIELRRCAPARDDDAAHGQLSKSGEVRCQRTQRRLVGDFNQIVHAGVRARDDAATKRLGQARGRLARRADLRGEIHLDPVGRATAGEPSAKRVKTRRFVCVQDACRPEHVRARKGGVTTQLHLDRRREPTQRPAAFNAMQKGGLGEIHFTRDPLHPRFIRRHIGHAHRGRIAGERRVCE